MSTPEQHPRAQARSAPEDTPSRSRVTLVVVAVTVAVLAALAVLVGPHLVSAQAVNGFAPTVSDPDPTTRIPGVTSQKFPPGLHVGPEQRVNYPDSPAYGGPHDQVWALCNGVVYPRALRQENAVHSMEHGAVWVTYDPAVLTADQVSALAAKVSGKPYMLMSPFPNLGTAVSVQGWGRQLKLSDPTDIRLDEFIAAVRLNPNVTPEPGATCDLPPAAAALFDVGNPPPYDPSVPGADAVQMDGKGQRR